MMSNFVADVTKLTKVEVQADINIVAQCAAENYTLLSLDKYGVHYCGKQ